RLSRLGGTSRGFDRADLPGARVLDLLRIPRDPARRGQARASAQIGPQLQSREVRARRGRDPQRSRRTVRSLRMGHRRLNMADAQKDLRAAWDELLQEVPTRADPMQQ